VNSNVDTSIRSYPIARKLKHWTVTNHLLWSEMNKRHLSTEDLAAQLNITVRTVQRWIFEGSAPMEEHANLVAKTLGVPKKSLFTAVSLRNGRRIELTSAGWVVESECV
jgi:transcriptional regulator with XRE-family HTH domain